MSNTTTGTLNGSMNLKVLALLNKNQVQMFLHITAQLLAPVLKHWRKANWLSLM